MLSPDPNVFHHTNALAGLKEGGTFIIQSDLDDPAKVWATIPIAFQQTIVEKNIRVFFLDAFPASRATRRPTPTCNCACRVSRSRAHFFARRPCSRTKRARRRGCSKAIATQLEYKFGSKGARVVEDNMRVVKRGFDEVQEDHREAVHARRATEDIGQCRRSRRSRSWSSRLPQSKAPMTDIHRFWEQTGNFYARGMGNDNLTDPFIGLGIMPGAYRHTSEI